MFVPCFSFFKCLFPFFNKNKPLRSHCMIGPIAGTIIIIIIIVVIIVNVNVIVLEQKTESLLLSM